MEENEYGEPIPNPQERSNFDFGIYQNLRANTRTITLDSHLDMEQEKPIKKSSKVLKEKKTNQKLYKYRIYKDFEMPSFAIDSGDIDYNLMDQAYREVWENSKNRDYFQGEIVDVIPFTTNKYPNMLKEKFNYSKLVKALTLEEIQKEYGELDFDKNPDLFEREEKDGFRVTFNLKDEIQDKMYDLNQKYNQIAKNCYNKF